MNLERFRLKRKTVSYGDYGACTRYDVILQCRFKINIFKKQFYTWVTIHEIDPDRLPFYQNEKELTEQVINSWLNYREATIKDRIRNRVLNKLDV